MERLKEIFIKYIQYRIKGRNILDSALDTDILDVDFLCGLTRNPEAASDLLFEYIFGTEALDWMNWWLYEKGGPTSNSPLEAHDKDGNVIPTDTIEDLWNLIAECYVDKQKKVGIPE